MSRPSWNPGRRHGTHSTLSPKIVLGELLAVGRGGDGDAAVGVEVVDVGGVDQAVHGRVDRRRRAALAVKGSGRRRRPSRPPARRRGRRRRGPAGGRGGARPGRLGERAEVAAGALDPQQVDGLAGDRVDVGALGRRVAAGVVRGAWGRRRAGCERASSSRRRRASVSRAPPGLVAADPVGDDALGVAAGARRRPWGRPAGRGRPASRPGRGGRRWRRRPS